MASFGNSLATPHPSAQGAAAFGAAVNASSAQSPSSPTDATDPKERSKNFKKGVDQDNARRRREETTINIRKKKKEERLNKRRAAAGGASEGGEASGMSATTPLPQEDNMEQEAQQQPMDPATAAKLQELPNMVAAIMSGDSKANYDATVQFRKLLSIEKNPPIQAVINAGVVPRLVQFLQNNAEPKTQFEASWALTNVASGTSQHTRTVIESGAIPIFCSLLGSPIDDVREQAVWALGNIAGDSPGCRDQVSDAAAAPLLLLLCLALLRLSWPGRMPRFLRACLLAPSLNLAGTGSSCRRCPGDAGDCSRGGPLDPAPPHGQHAAEHAAHRQLDDVQLLSRKTRASFRYGAAHPADTGSIGLLDGRRRAVRCLLGSLLPIRWSVPPRSSCCAGVACCLTGCVFLRVPPSLWMTECMDGDGRVAKPGAGHSRVWHLPPARGPAAAQERHRAAAGPAHAGEHRGRR